MKIYLFKNVSDMKAINNAEHNLLYRKTSGKTSRSKMNFVSLLQLLRIYGRHWNCEAIKWNF